jgi:hypothetical protein
MIETLVYVVFVVLAGATDIRPNTAVIGADGTNKLVKQPLVVVVAVAGADLE